MRFRFCGDLDCPDWVLAEISTLAKISSVKLRLLCSQVLKELLGQGIDYEKILKLTADAKFESGDVKATVAVLSFILSSAAKHSVDGESLSSELQQLGLPKGVWGWVLCIRLYPSRENVLRNLSDKAFDRPICEALLDQRFFNGIGNYLRAEILYRLRIPPFEKARTVLEALQHHRPSPEMTLSQKIRAKLQNPDLLELCHSVPKEVVQLGGKGYGPEHGEEDFAAFRAWLRCYGMPGMSSLRDRHGRTIWFQGDPGPLAPKGGKSRKKKSQETQLQPKEKLEDLPPPNKAPSRTPRARRHLPKKTAIQQPEGTSLQQDLKAPTVPEKGRRKGKQATTERRGPWKNKADNPSKGSGRTSAS
ncbi:Hypothetical predicted protein [Marmota monax]|uniref:Formamidopyrimidine-DNA glycosylase H2TH DNA-binding domain-containing protein n=1 Tax=Marmota monax TaxID=9995 RepID=A0A5E4B9L4_MARMO|nr:Hypothetical predicted protein [Marmota monax]